MTDWPVRLRGVTETVVTTRGPNGKWNAAALGVHEPENAGAPATARTWGRTRTRRNFHREGGGYVQFTPDPVDFVRAACAVYELDDPILESADAWARVGADPLGTGETDGTSWEEWALSPEKSKVRRRRPFTANRGYYAVVEATVAASRLDVPSYDAEVLRDRLAYFADVAETCGGDREREAFALLDDLTDWRTHQAD